MTNVSAHPVRRGNTELVFGIPFALFWQTDWVNLMHRDDNQTAERAIRV